MNCNPPSTHRAGVLIADDRTDGWGAGLASRLLDFPVDVLWSRSDHEALDLLSAGRIHVAVVDDGLPGGGLNLLRRVRGLGLELPCLLVAAAASPRLLHDALALNVFSVVAPTGPCDLVAPMVLKALRHATPFGGTGEFGEN